VSGGKHRRRQESNKRFHLLNIRTFCKNTFMERYEIIYILFNIIKMESLFNRPPLNPFCQNVKKAERFVLTVDIHQACRNNV
jgi:hypothetical protein